MMIACPGERLARVLKRWGLPVEDPGLNVAALARFVGMDKKNSRGRLRFVRLDAPGKPRIEELDAEGLSALIREAASRFGSAGAAK
jgi:3-dehydroquinate synthetase